MNNNELAVIENKNFKLDVKVMLDRDWIKLYKFGTKRLNEQFKRFFVKINSIYLQKTYNINFTWNKKKEPV